MPAVQPATVMSQQRRHSSASSDAGSDHGLPSPSRHTSQENIAIIPTRTTKVVASKPAANPLQFVKVGPCDLSRFAQEQLKKAEEVKKVKPEKRDEAEDWQSNLDNWKVSRRKRQEHIIERVVEVKKLELEEHDRNRRRSKTFNEMLEERTSKGRKTSLPIYKDDDNDLSDLGLSTHKSRENGDDSVFEDCKSTSTSRDNLSSTSSSVVNGENGTNGTSTNGHHDEEYTYDRAIQNYVNFTESRMRGRSLTPSEDNSNLTNGLSKKSQPPVPAKPRRGSCKIEEKLTELEQIKKKSMSTNDLSENSKKLIVPKVDILKRREMFEKSQDEETSNTKNRSSGEFGSTKSIRDRLNSFSRASEDTQVNKKLNRISGEISVKDRLSSIERQNSTERNSSPPKSSPAVNGTPITQSVKERLSSLQKSSSTESKPATLPSQVTNEKPKPKEDSITKTSKKENSNRISENNQIDRIKENNNKNVDHSLTNGTFKEEEIVDEDTREKSTFSPSEDMYESKRQQHYRHRSLDSLDVDSTEGLGNESFERVQSLEDLDFCRNYPPSSVSGDTDREDSGIHTADVSSSVSQADDCDSHLDGEFHQPPTILEEINKNSELTSALIVKQINQMNVSEAVVEIPNEVVAPEVVDNSSAFLKLPLKLDCDPLPVILESPSEPFPPTGFAEPSVSVSSSTPVESSHNLSPSRPNVTEIKSDKNSIDKSESVNISCKPDKEQCNLTLADGGGETSTANSVIVNTSPISLPVSLSAAEVLHDSETGAIEISHKIELEGSPKLSSLPEPVVSVETEYVQEPKKKFEGVEAGAEAEGGHHLTALTVDIGDKPELAPLFPSTDHKLMEGIEVVFPLSPSTLEPPKEKPPPPPTETSDDDDPNSINNKPVSLRRLDSTKRIKKEIRQKRSSFLGIEGSNDDNYLEPELELVRRPPDISSFLAEEKRLEQQLLYRQSICSESESRDSGVELEKHNDDLNWTTLHHSRDNSETYANTSTTSEEEEIVKKEREILEMLEREEINRYNSSTQEQDNIGEKLAERLRELEAEKCRLEWERRAEAAARQQHQSRMQARELELCKQENAQDVQELDVNTEMLMAERARLEAEQASLARQRDLMLQQQYNHNHNRSLTDVRVLETGYGVTGDYRRSMTDLRAPELPVNCYRPVQAAAPEPVARRPPPPIPPAKPLIIPRSPEKRVSSGSPQQMSRQTLAALAAAPKPKLNDSWLQPRRNPKPNNYQHWLIQEAEQRRITEHHQRQAPPPRRPVPPPPQPQQWAGGSPQYTNWQPPQQQHKPLPDAIIQTLTQRVQNRLGDGNNNRRRMEPVAVPVSGPTVEPRTPVHSHTPISTPTDSQEKMLSVSGKKKCSHCGDELGRGAAMIIESLRLFYHIDCFKCCVCCVQLGDGLMGTDVRVRNNKLHCHNCYSSDDGVKFSCV